MNALATSVLKRLDDRLDGRLLVAGDAGYDEARAVWKAMIDRRPRVIVRCWSTDDVAAAIRFAREHDLEIGVRCGGHSVLGLAVLEDGLMIDLTPMAGVRVDTERRRAWVQGAALLGALDRAARAHGLATTAGNVSHTGLGGLTLGRGMRWLARQHGLSCDNVCAFELVSAEGTVIRARETENRELFPARGNDRDDDRRRANSAQPRAARRSDLETGMKSGSERDEWPRNLVARSSGSTR